MKTFIYRNGAKFFCQIHDAIEYSTNHPFTLLKDEASVSTIELLSDYIVSGTVIIFDDYFNFPGWKEDGHAVFRGFAEKKLERNLFGLRF